MAEAKNHSGPKSFGTSPKKSCFELGDRTIPGPGMYNPFKHNNIHNPQWRMGKSTQRDTFLDPHLRANPSPQSYKINHSSIEKQANKFTIPKSSSKHPKISEISAFNKQPSQAYYAQNKGFSFGYTFQINYDNQLPGPATYEPVAHDHSLNKTQNHFSVGNRPTPYGQQAKYPGPTKYYSKEKKSEQYSFTRDERFRQETKDSPGVFYQLSPTKKIPAKNRIFDIRPAKRDTIMFQHNQNPAPNHYNHNLKHKIPSGIIETSQRSELANTAMVNTPSPDKYTGAQILLNRNIGCSFMKEVRHLSVTERLIPAPGTYEPMKTFSTMGGAIGKQKQREINFVTPSACYYKPKQNLTKARGQSTIIMKADRIDFSKTITGPIGPGSYNLKGQTHRSQMGKIGSSQRRKIQLNEFNPGVGNYSIPNTIGKLPSYYNSPKKLNQNGYSTFHQKLKFKMLQRQKLKFLENQEDNVAAPDLQERKSSEPKNVVQMQENH